MPTLYPRRFVKHDDVLDTFERIEPYFTRLLSENPSDPAALEAWLLAGSELSACVSEQRTHRYVSMTCHTDNEEFSKRYLDWIENVAPRCKPLWHRLNVKYVETPAAARLDPRRYFVMDRSTRASVELFRDENVPLMTEESRLAQHYQTVCGAMTVQFDGEEKTLAQMGVYSESPDRKLRQEAWELSANRRLQDREKLEDIFENLLQLRGDMARNADLSNYRDYAFRAYQRFDYTPRDCEQFHEAIERAVVPLARTINERRRKNLGVDTLRPWDQTVDEKGRDRLTPFEKAAELSSKCQDIFTRVDPELGARFADMIANDYMDLESRKGKAPGGYQSTFEEQRRPFIFMNAVGLHHDVETLLHEGGHAFHTYATRDEDLIDYRSAPIEFAEVASMSMELLAMEHYDAFYDGEDLDRAKRKQLEGVIQLFPWVARIDAFQHWLYTHPNHTRDQRKAAWQDLERRFGTGVDWTGYEHMAAYSWQRQLHLFEVPFYYVEYAIAQLGALQVWLNAKSDRRSAVRMYREGLALGGSRPLPELFAAAGARFDFSADTLGRLMSPVQKELDALDS